MHAATGAPLHGRGHVRQSILDILTTRVGERVMRPEYGSRIHELIDAPINAAFLVDLYYEAITAIHRWEPRVQVVRARASEITEGRVVLDLAVTLGGDPEVQIAGLTLWDRPARTQGTVAPPPPGQWALPPGALTDAAGYLLLDEGGYILLEDA